jgi:hypothetical protein
MRLTDKERLELWGMRHSFTKSDVDQAVGEFSGGITDLLESGNPSGVYRALAGIEQVKSVFQRMHNYNHTVGMLAAKAFLEGEFPEAPWHEIEFAGDANRAGPDILVVRPSVRIIGQLKTTVPCGRNKTGTSPMTFGSNQRKEIEKDLQTLADSKYDGFARYMFVTSGLAYECLVREYRHTFSTICFLLLSVAAGISRPSSTAQI